VDDAERAFDAAMAQVHSGVQRGAQHGAQHDGQDGAQGPTTPPAPVTVVVTGAGGPDAVADAVRRALLRERDR
jgi:hypothetical protein